MIEACPVIALFLIGSGILLFYFRHKQARQLDEYNVVATRLNWPVEKGNTTTYLKTLRHFSLFSQGTAPKIQTVLSGTIQNTEVKLLDYTHGSLTDNRTFRYTVLWFTSDKLRLPAFRLRQKEWVDQTGIRSWETAVSFPEETTFSEQYLLIGNHPTEVETLFAGDIVAFYDQMARQQHFPATEGDGQHLIYYRRQNTAVTPETIQSFITEADQAIQLFLQNQGTQRGNNGDQIGSG